MENIKVPPSTTFFSDIFQRLFKIFENSDYPLIFETSRCIGNLAFLSQNLDTICYRQAMKMKFKGKLYSR